MKVQVKTLAAQSVGYLLKEDEAALEQLLSWCRHWAKFKNVLLFKDSQASEEWNDE